MDLAFEGAEQADPMLLNRIAWANRWRDRHRSTTYAKMARDRAETAGRAAKQVAGLAYRTLSWQSRWRGDFTAARREAESALSLLSGTDCSAAMADADIALSVSYSGRGKHREALEILERAWHRLGSGEGAETRIDILSKKAFVFLQLGRLQEARRALDEAQGLAGRSEKALVQKSLARFHFETGEPESAMAWALSAVASCKLWQNAVVMPYALHILGAANLRRGRLERARDCLIEALRIAEADRDRRVESKVVQQLGMLRLAEGNAAEAIRLLQKCRSLSRKLDYVIGEQSCCRDLARACEEGGMIEDALEAYKGYMLLSDKQAG